MVISGALFDDTDGSDVGLTYAYDISSLLPPGADFNDDGIVDDVDLLLLESYVEACRERFFACRVRRERAKPALRRVLRMH